MSRHRCLILLAVALAALSLFLLPGDDSGPAGPGRKAEDANDERGPGPVRPQPDEPDPPTPAPRDPGPSTVLLTGRVVAPDGVTPAAGVVVATNVERPSETYVARTAPDGSFVLPVGDRHRYRIQIIPEDPQWTSSRPFPEAQAGERDIVIRLALVARLRIQIDYAGRGPEEGELLVRVSDGFEAEGLGAVLVLEGRLLDRSATTRVPAGRQYRIEAESATKILAAPVEIWIPEDAGEAEVRLVLEDRPHPAGRIRLWVRDEDGRPVERLHVDVLYLGDLRLGADRNLPRGELEMELPAGPRRIVLRRPDDASEETEPWLPTTVDLQVIPGQEITGYATVVAGGFLRVLASPGIVRVAREGEPDREFRIGEPLPAGTWTVTWTGGNGEVRRAEAEIRAFETTEVTLD